MRKNTEMLKVSETNLALRGSDIEKKVRAAAAGAEEAWKGCGDSAALKVWRIEQFKVVPWPEKVFGRFFDGDSYIVLSSKKKNDSDGLKHDVHFWLGSYTTQDEAGAAAYKTVELDDHLGGATIPHREVQGHESDTFLNLFAPYGGMKIMEGGVASGFTHVEAGSGTAKAPVRAFHVYGASMASVRAAQVPPLPGSLNEGDAFVVDSGDRDIYVFQGKTCSPGEAASASRYAQSLQDGRCKGAKITVVRSDDAPGDFWKCLGCEAPVAIKETLTDAEKAAFSGLIRLFKLSDASGSLSFEEVGNGFKGGKLSKDLLCSDDAFVLDNRHEIYVWIGRGASDSEKINAMPSAQEYLNSHRSSAGGYTVPITVTREGCESTALKTLLAA